MRIGLKHRNEHLVFDIHQESGGYRVEIDGKPYRVGLQWVRGSTWTLLIDGERYRIDLVHDGRDRLVAIDGESYRFAPESAMAGAHHVENIAVPEVVAPMPGKVLQVLVQVGDQVEAGTGLLILEAMKMETRLVAEAAGTVEAVRVSTGDMVEGGQALVVLRYETA